MFVAKGALSSSFFMSWKIKLSCFHGDFGGLLVVFVVYSFQVT